LSTNEGYYSVELLYKDGCRTEGKMQRKERTTSQRKRRKRKVREFLQESKKNTSVVFF
jgi:hypothetical protein